MAALQVQLHSTGPIALDAQFDCQPGELLALLGPSGSGKTTLMALLPRFYEPESGDILLDGTPIRELRLAELRAHLDALGVHYYPEPDLGWGDAADTR